MAKYDARLSRIERTLASNSQGQSAMVTLPWTLELATAIAEVEAILKTPLSSLKKSDRVHALWGTQSEPSRHPAIYRACAWTRLSTLLIVAEQSPPSSHIQYPRR